MIYGPNGQYVVVDDAEEESEQMAEWATADPAQSLDEPVQAQVIRRGPGARERWCNGNHDGR